MTLMNIETITYCNIYINLIRAQFNSSGYFQQQIKQGRLGTWVYPVRWKFLSAAAAAVSEAHHNAKHS